MIQPRIDQRVTVAAGSGLESGVTGVVVPRHISAHPIVAIRDDSGRVFTMFSWQLRPAEEDIRPSGNST